MSYDIELFEGRGLACARAVSAWATFATESRAPAPWWP